MQLASIPGRREKRLVRGAGIEASMQHANHNYVYVYKIKLLVALCYVALASPPRHQHVPAVLSLYLSGVARGMQRVLQPSSLWPQTLLHKFLLLTS